MNGLLFTAPAFLFLFLPVVLFCYAIAPRAAKNTLLVAASILFYALGEGYTTAVILFSIVFNFYMGRAIDAQSNSPRARKILAFALAINLLLLVSFKYAGFLVDLLNSIIAPLNLHFPQPGIHLPIGISFFTFHAISCLVDIHRREVRPMRQLEAFALYITLFPQLIAGPIIRYKTICDQLTVASPADPHGRRQTWEGFAQGVRRFIIGLGKKMLIANLVAPAADDIFNTPGLNISPGAAWLGILCYTLYIYFDFSGYSDMAIGLGRMFGFRFPENFNYPYIAVTVTDFWHRWHITLSTWFRDYLYIPLGGNRISPRRTYLNLLIVFCLCGLWHGAAWNFLAWGLFNGWFLILERLGFKSFLPRLPRILQHAYFLLFIAAAWIIFRSPTVPAALQYLARLAGIGFDPAAPSITADLYLHRQSLIAMAAGCLGSVPWLPALRQTLARRSALRKTSPLQLAAGRLLETAALISIFLAAIAFSAIGTYNPFIYYRF